MYSHACIFLVSAVKRTVPKSHVDVLLAQNENQTWSNEIRMQPVRATKKKGKSGIPPELST